MLEISCCVASDKRMKFKEFQTFALNPKSRRKWLLDKNRSDIIFFAVEGNRKASARKGIVEIGACKATSY